MDKESILLLDKYLRAGEKTILQTVIINEHLTIQFLNKVISATMSDKTLLGRSNNLRKEAEELKARLTGKGNEEVKIKHNS